MSEPQPKKVSVRRRNLEVQLQIALDDAAKAMTADISVQKLVQTRLDCLLKMQARDKTDKLNRALTDIKAAKAEIERLKSELAKALAAKPVVPPMSAVKQLLAQHEAGKSTGGEQ